MILITGGTGLVGSHLLYTLLKEGHHVRAIHRKGSDLSIVQKVFGYYGEDAISLARTIEWMEANIIDLPQLEKAFEGITHVYHAAAYVDFNPKNYYKLKKANIEGTANIVNLCLAYNIQKLCYVSSIATLGTSTNGDSITEDTHWNPESKNSVYAITKYGAEMEVWRGSQEGLQTVIVNPGVIIGEGLWHKGSGSLVRWVAKGISHYTSGTIGIVDVLDVVKAMVLAMNSSLHNERFILVAANKSYQLFLTELAKALGQKPPTKEMAKWKLVLLSKIDGFFSFLIGTRRRLVRSHVDALFNSDAYSGSKIEQVLPFSYRPVGDTFSRVSSNYLKDIDVTR